MDNPVQRISRFDLVMLKTTKNVKYLSAPPGSKATPDGIWSVSAIVENDLLVVKDLIVIRIPAQDVIKVGDYDEASSALMKPLEKKNG